MKTESSAAYIARLAITLLLITAVVAAGLACVNAVTAPEIEALNVQKTQNAIQAVLPGGGEEIAFTDDSGIVSTIYKGQSGYAVGCGVLTVMIRYFGGYNEGVSYAILCMNCCTVLLDKIGRPVKFGAPKKEAAK